jgi:hypothetical protein
LHREKSFVVAATPSSQVSGEGNCRLTDPVLRGVKSIV